MDNIIYLNFKNIDKRVINYVKQKRRLKLISADDAVKLLMVLEGVFLPQKPARIIEPDGLIDYDKIYAWFISTGNDLLLVFRKLEMGIKNYRTMHGVDMETHIVKTELANILVNFR